MEVIVPVWGEREAYDWGVAWITRNERSADQYDQKSIQVWRLALHTTSSG